MKKILLILLLLIDFGFAYDRYTAAKDYAKDNRVSQKCEKSLFAFDIDANMMDRLILPSIIGYKEDNAFDLNTSYALFSTRYKSMKKEIIEISLSCVDIYEQMYAFKRLNFLNEIEALYIELKAKELVK